MDSRTPAGGVKTSEWAAAVQRRGVEGLAADLSRQRILMGQRSVVYQRALEHLRAIVDAAVGDAAIVAKLERSWRERTFGAYYDRPLLLLASMRLDALVEGPRHPLYRAFAADAPDEKVVTREAIQTALAPTRLSVWLTLATRRVQTNEVSRAVAWLWPALLAGCEGGRRPIAIFDVGAAAGLNLIADALPAIWTDDVHKPLPVARQIVAAHRLGFDPAPLDVRNEDDVAWMRACLWPGETKRHARFEMALAAMRTALDGPEPRPRVHAVPAHLVPGRLDTMARATPGDTLLLAYQTMVRGYIDRDKREGYERAMHSWLASLAPGRACWIELEMADDSEGEALPAELVAHVNAGTTGNGVKTLRLARCGYHPHEIAIDPAGGNEFVRRMKG